MNDHREGSDIYYMEEAEESEYAEDRQFLGAGQRQQYENLQESDSNRLTPASSNDNEDRSSLQQSRGTFNH